MRSHTFEAAGSSETGRLLVAISGSPSFKSGMTSDSFQRLGKTDDIRERFTISLRIGKMHGRASLITARLVRCNSFQLCHFLLLRWRCRRHLMRGSCFSAGSRFFPADTVVLRGGCLAGFEDFSFVLLNYGL